VSRSKKEVQPFWRPNFVNQSELPDIKVIRTDFIINFIAVTLACCAAFFFTQKEYRAYSLTKTIEDMEQQVRLADVEDAQNLKLSESFRSAAQYVVEVEKFYNAPLMAHDFLYNVSVIKPADLIFNAVSLNESFVKLAGKETVTYNINITGDAKNLTVLDGFKKVLEGAKLLQAPGVELQIGETLQGRDEETGIFPYQLTITLTPVASGNSAKGGDAP